MLSFDFINFSGIINHASPKTYTEGGGKMAVQKENNRLNGELIDEEAILTNSLMGEIHSLDVDLVDGYLLPGQFDRLLVFLFLA